MADKMPKLAREARFNILNQFFASNSQGLFSVEDVKRNFAVTNCFIYESEMEKFAAAFPVVPQDAFRAFVTETGALKVTGSKVGSGTSTRLNSVEAAQLRGVTPELTEAYISEINQIYALCKSLNEKMVVDGKALAKCSFAIPVIKAKEAEAEAPATV